MKRIVINGSYEVDAEEYNYTLVKVGVKTSKDGTTGIKRETVGYFASLDGVFKKLFDMTLKDKIDGSISLDQLRGLIIQTKKEITDMLTIVAG
jgi:hypothetical protein